MPAETTPAPESAILAPHELDLAAPMAEQLKPPRLPRCPPVVAVPVSAASPVDAVTGDALITVRSFVSTEGRLLFIADGPGCHKSLLARETEQAAMREGTEYFLRTRKRAGLNWVLR